MNWTYNFAHHLSYTDLSTLAHGSCSANKTHNAKGMELVPSLLDLRRKHETRHDSLDSGRHANNPTVLHPVKLPVPVPASKQ